MGITGTGKPRSAKRGDVDVPRCVKGGRRRWRAGIAVPLMMAAAGAHAESWKFEPFVNLSETFTNNVLLQPNDTRKSDWVTELTPGARITEAGAHSSLIGLVSLPTLLYARTSSENQVVPNINLLGKLELSGVSHLLKTLKNNDVRTDKVAVVKAQIEAGTYDDEKKLDAAVDKLLDDLLK